MENSFIAECNFVDGDSYFQCKYDMNPHTTSKTKETKNLRIAIPSNMRSERETSNITFIGYCDRGYKMTTENMINKVLFESYYHLCKK